MFKKQVLSRLVLLVVLLPLTAVQADSAKRTSQSEPANKPVYINPYKALKRNKPTYAKSGSFRPSGSKKVTTDHYERLMRQVVQPRPTTTVWIGNKNRANRPQLPKTTWLGRRGRSD